MKKSTQVAVGGLASALCLLLMFLTGMIPFTTYALPAMAGIVLIAVVIENGTQTAALVYVSVSLLSLFLSPDKEAALMFLCFFGYYPVIKAKLEQIRPKLLELLAKYGIFNLAIIATYWVISYVLGLPDILEELGELGKYSIAILLGMGNLVFFLYDRALTNLVTFYVRWFRVKVLRKI